MTIPALERVLVVEDDADVQSVIALALESVGGFVVELCASGAEAIERAPRFVPDLVLLDVMMPGMDGPQTLRALRVLPEVAAVPCVFLTARVQAHEIDAYRRAGACDVIVKPFEPMDLAERLRAIWGRLHDARA